MKKACQIITVATLAMSLIACGTSKKKSAAANPSSTPTPPPATPAPNFVFVTPSIGISIPGENELIAIRLKYPDATMNQLTEGHSIYTKGACIKCHGANNIYNYTEIKWKEIIDEMSIMAKLSDTQKDAVYKYVLSLKATQEETRK